MLRSAIVSILEPPDYSLNTSVAWKLTSGIKAKSQYMLLDSSGAALATLSGLAPVLQPVQVQVAGQPGLLMMMRGSFDVPNPYGWPVSEGYSLATDTGTTLGTVVLCSEGLEYAVPLLVLHPQFQNLQQGDVSALRAYSRQLVATHWGAEPIDWTTHNLILMSNGRLQNGEEAAQTGLARALLMVSGGSFTIEDGTPLRPVSFKMWRRADKVSMVGAGASSDCDSAETSHSTGGYYLDHSDDDPGSSYDTGGGGGTGSFGGGGS